MNKELLNDDPKILEAYSRDASLFRIKPKYVASPKSAEDIQKLVLYAKEHGESLTPRAGGSDMSGGPLTDSIVVDVSNLNKIGEINEAGTTVGPGAYYRDFEKKASEKGLLLPCYPASKNMCAMGGMIGNNCGGEKTLRYGKMEDYIVESKWIFSDGREYAIRKGEMDNEFAHKINELLISNEELIKKAKPKVSKNSAGYYLWNVLQDGAFDLNRLLVGSQGTLGIMTEATVRLVPEKAHHDLIALFFKSWDDMPEVVNAILPFAPESLETFDKETIKLGMRFMPFTFATTFIHEALVAVEMLGLPELVILVEVSEETEEGVKDKVKKIVESIKPYKVWHRVVEDDSREDEFWNVRRESFNLLRKHVAGKRTVPLVDDFCIPTERVPEFLPEAKAILERYGIHVNIAGHAGNGNFHIIPLMNLKDPKEREKLIPVANEFYDLVGKYHGTTTGEHNDGIVRTPYLDRMFSPEVLELFQKVKNIFDPQNIFNPHKKVDVDMKYWEAHLDF